MMIKPTVGRMVWFWPDRFSREFIRPSDIEEQPCAAIICRVWGDRCINAVVFDAAGNQHRFSSITLLQDGDQKPENGHYCSWMPYQVGQAKAAAEVPSLIPTSTLQSAS